VRNVFLIYPCPRNKKKDPISWKINGEGSPTYLTAVFANLLEMSDYFGEEDLANKLNEDLVRTI
jgi:hypothetical protein